MADSKITALTALTAADPVNDMFPIVDVSDTTMAASGTTKKISVNNILGASGTATLASATITGALTAGGNVGFGTTNLTSIGGYNTLKINNATTGAILDLAQGDAYRMRLIGSTAGAIIETAGTNPFFVKVGGLDSFRIDAAGVFNWYDGAGGTRMTLSSTGLGVGGSPSRKLSVSGAGGGFDLTDTTQSTRIRMRSSSASNFYIEALNSAESAYVTLRLNDTTQIDASGNCGIGVAPSAWGTGLKALQVGARGYGSFFDFNNDVVGLTSNLFWTGTAYSRISTSSKYAVAYYHDIGNGSHQWLSSSAAGTNGVTPTMNTNMTLDASGNLLVGKTATGFGTVGNEVKANGEVFSTQASISNVASTYHVYSTGAAAYRFYVGMGGTVFATNTTISAISDARFKENVQDIDVGLGAILALKPRKFDWKDGKGKNIKGDRGFIAQEFETVFPNLIDEWKENAPEGEAPYKSVRQDLIPVLVKAIQELTARVQTLETR